jgi:dienelactone hydrolase
LKPRFVILGLVFLVAMAVAKPEGFPRGRVISRVDCAGQPGQSYALYLPTNYDALKKWPAIFAFDPMGQGSRPAGLLQPAAEKYGYIVIASNNSRNGPISVSVEAMQAVWIDSRRRFSVDDKRIYAVGFSGGARVAMRFGLSLSGRVQGVIPAGGGLPADMEVKSPLSFAVYSIVGIRDFNYSEMKDLDRRCADWGVPHHLDVTEQEHRWPSREVARHQQASEKGEGTRSEPRGARRAAYSATRRSTGEHCQLDV